MNTTLTGVAEGEPRPRQNVTLWNLQASLARLADELADAVSKFDAAGDKQPAQNSMEAMNPRQYFASLLELRRTRERYFGKELFGEPAWDIMLELMLARIDGVELRASDLQGQAQSPEIVTRHYLEALVEAKLVEAFANADNVEDSFLSLSSEAARRMAELYRARMRG